MQDRDEARLLLGSYKVLSIEYGTVKDHCESPLC